MQQADDTQLCRTKSSCSATGGQPVAETEPSIMKHAEPDAVLPAEPDAALPTEPDAALPTEPDAMVDNATTTTKREKVARKLAVKLGRSPTEDEVQAAVERKLAKKAKKELEPAPAESSRASEKEPQSSSLAVSIDNSEGPIILVWDINGCLASLTENRRRNNGQLQLRPGIAQVRQAVHIQYTVNGVVVVWCERVCRCAV